jgi:predicted acylesterase/phospholipase RssA
MTTETTPAAPFGTIALCISGGGYRASTYGLGTIDMLDLLGLLDDVMLISTVSGGTFTGVTYALSVADGKSYGTYFNEFYTFLKTTNCVQLALDELYKPAAASGRDDVSLIRAAAYIYDTRLFDRRGRTFSDLQAIVGEGKRFLELIHNATEFRKGNSFRFRASHNPKVFAGNGDFLVSKEIAADIPLADVVAASSCFPGGFEPIRFPEDFLWAEGVDAIRKELKKDVITGAGPKPSGFRTDDDGCLSLPLMDGGIYDNQGVSNAVEADRTVADKNVPIIDLFLICDTSGRDNDMLKYPKPDERAGWLSIDMLFWAAAALFVFALTSAGFLSYYLVTAVDTRALSWPRFIFQYLSPIALFIVLAGILGWIYDLFRKNKEIVVSGAKFRLWPVVKKLSVPDLINMVKARLTSLGTMAGDVFMKRIRSLQFDNVMDSNRKSKVSFDLIYDMNPTIDRTELWALDPDLQPTDLMKEISACAEAFPTTLWFPETETEQIIVEENPNVKVCREKHPDRPALLLACGQCTTCFSLLKYLWLPWLDKDKKPAPDVPKPNNPASPYFGIYTELKKVWEQLKADPYSLVERERV